MTHRKAAPKHLSRSSAPYGGGFSASSLWKRTSYRSSKLSASP
jgi:hypothetical protein